MNKVILSELSEQFKRECKVINMKNEYPGYEGIEVWGIITSLSPKQLYERFEKQIIPLEPFIVLPNYFDQIRTDFLRNERKHKKRAERSICIFNYSEDTECHHPEILLTLSPDEEIVIREGRKRVRAAIENLSPVQKRRIIKRFFQGKSLRKIAMEEGRSYAAVYESYLLALQNLKCFLENSN